MKSALYLMAFIAGFGLTIQVGLNAALRNAFGSAAMASLVNFLVGIVGLLLFVVATRTVWPSKSALAAAPAWAWFGGLLGAFYVATATIVGPRLGAAALLALVVFGQLLSGLLVDHFGWLGFEHQPITAVKLVGAVLLLAGVLLIVR